jgi:hypothetical protein
MKSWGPLGPPISLRLAWMVIRGDRELFHAAIVNINFPPDAPDANDKWDKLRDLTDLLRGPEENPFRMEFYAKLAETGMGISAYGHVVADDRALWQGELLFRVLERSRAIEAPDRSRWLLPADGVPAP